MNTMDEQGTGQGTDLDWGQFAEDVGTITDAADGNDTKYDEFNRQIPNPDLCDSSYRSWLNEYDPDKLKRSGDIWSAPNSITQWRDKWRGAQLAVREMAPGLTGPQEWAIIAAGSWDGAMNWSPPVQMQPGGAGPGSVPGVGANAGGFVMVWPWQPNAFKGATVMHYAVWAGIAYVLYSVVQMAFGRRSYRKRRKPL